MLKEAFEGLLSQTLAEIQRHYGDRLVTVAVYGAVGRGTMRSDSDVDLLVIARELPHGQRKRREEFACVKEALSEPFRGLRARGIQTELMPVIKSPEEAEIGSPLFLNMVVDARVLYDRDGFLHGDSSACERG
jgi:predicted nucleotidyltransferase